MKTFLKSVIGTVVLACASAHAAPASAPTAPANASAAAISDDLYHRIALASLGPKPSNAQTAERTAAVRAFIAGNGGDVIYQGYLTQYGAPKDPRAYLLAEQSHVSDKTLGYWYIHPAPTSAEALTYGVCHPSFVAKGPTQRALCALSEWNAYLLTKDEAYRQSFMEHAVYFVKESRDGKIEWTIELPANGMKSPWISGLTQGMVTSVLLRAYQTTSDQTYLNAAKQTYRWLTIPMSEGGVRSAVKGGIWLEEYPNVSNPSQVLNGHMWALLGVWDYYRVTGDRQAHALFRSGVAALKVHIPAWYDVGYWNVYSRLNRVDMVNGIYMNVIVQQMYVLHAITGDRFFKEVGARWQADQETDALFVHNMAKAFASTKK